MSPVELCRIVARAEMRPFEDIDYSGWSGVSRAGPHEIGEADGWTVIRDGSYIEISRMDESGEVESWFFNMGRP